MPSSRSVSSGLSGIKRKGLGIYFTPVIRVARITRRARVIAEMTKSRGGDCASARFFAPRNAQTDTYPGSLLAPGGIGSWATGGNSETPALGSCLFGMGRVNSLGW